MKKKLLLVITPFLLASCAIKLPFGPKTITSSESTSISSLEESSVKTSESSSSKNDSSSKNTSSSTSSSSTKTSSATTTSSGKTSSSSTTTSSGKTSSNSGTSTSTSKTSATDTSSSKTTSATSEDEDESDRPMLDCGWYAMPLPKNHDNPEQLVTTLSDGGSHFSNNTFEQELPDGFRYAYTNSYDDGPSGKRASPDFYSEKDGGGLKLAREGIGFQTKQFQHTGEKLEVRLKYRLFKAGGDPDTSKNPAKIYGFDKDGNLIGSRLVEKAAFSSTESIGEYKFYWYENTANLAYMEFRLLTNPYKSGKKYNLEIQACNYTSWERAF